MHGEQYDLRVARTQHTPRLSPHCGQPAAYRGGTGRSGRQVCPAPRRGRGGRSGALVNYTIELETWRDRRKRGRSLGAGRSGLRGN